MTLTVTDNRGDTATTTRTVTAVAPNVAPLARFTAAADDLAVALDAASSVDSDGTHHLATPGTTATARRPPGRRRATCTPRAGTYPVTLTVTDDRGGRSHHDPHRHRRSPPTCLPTAGFTAAVDDLALRLDASSSTDSDGTLVGYAWTFGDGATGTGRTATHTYAAAGQYPVTLTVTDDRGGVATTTRTVTAIAPNVLPTARFAPTVDDLTVALDGSASSDPDGTLRTLRWDLGDGTVLDRRPPRSTPTRRPAPTR